MTITPEVLAKNWKSRNADIEAAMREFLAQYSSDAPPLSTMSLAAALMPDGTKNELGKLGSVLCRLAPWMGVRVAEKATHFLRFGRHMHHWKWKGQHVKDNRPAWVRDALS